MHYLITLTTKFNKDRDRPIFLFTNINTGTEVNISKLILTMYKIFFKCMWVLGGGDLPQEFTVKIVLGH